MALHTTSRSPPILLSRNERIMPSWVNTQSDRVGPKPPLPPSISLPESIVQPVLPPKSKIPPEPDYEVIEFSQQQYSNATVRPSSSGSSGNKTPDVKSKCTLCGCNNSWVTCDECPQQIFCVSCDDMFHKHPKRKNHIRKTLEQSKPPLPPKMSMGHGGQLPPVAPPRRNKRGILTPLMQRKDQVQNNSFGLRPAYTAPSSPAPSLNNEADWQVTNLGNFKSGNFNIMNRPLPATPKTSPSQISEDQSSRSDTPKSLFDNIQRPPSVTLEKIKNKANATLDRMQLLQQRYRQQKERVRNPFSEQMPQQHTSRNDQPNARGLSTSVFNLPQTPPPRKSSLHSNGWISRPPQLQQAQSMAQLNCVKCHHVQPQPGSWNSNPAMIPMAAFDPWSNQLHAQQSLNHSNLSLNVPPGYVMPHPSHQMYPPPVFMNQRGVMYPAQAYMGSMGSIMNPGIVSVPPVPSRAGSRIASPALSRKSLTLRRKQNPTYFNNEPTDDEDSDEDDRRSIISNRSGFSRYRQRRLSSASQCQYNHETETLHNRNHRQRVRERNVPPRQQHQQQQQQQKQQQQQQVNDNYHQFNKITSSSKNGEGRPLDSDFNSSVKSFRIYSDLDSEGSTTKALIQAKIKQKLKEEDERKRKNKSNSKNDGKKTTKQTTGVQTCPIKSKSLTKKSDEDEEEETVIQKETISQEPKMNEAYKDNNQNKIENTEEETALLLGPPPATPNYEWECEFCTFVNEANVKICSVCCKTPSKEPKKCGKNMASPKKVTSDQNVNTTFTPKQIDNNAFSSNEKIITNNIKVTNIDIKEKQESLEDIWATLDENIQSTAHEVNHKSQNLLSSIDDSPRNIERQMENMKQPPVRSISISSVSTLHGKNLDDACLTLSGPIMNPTNINSLQFNDNVQVTDLYKYTAEELNAAVKYSGPNMHPLQWLQENWPKLITTVQSLATKYGQERIENTIGTISQIEARDALRLHNGNIWQAVTECIEQRQRKYREISNTGNFSREDIVTALTIHQGNVNLALTDLERSQLKPFLMRIWGSPGGVENESGSITRDMQERTNMQHSSLNITKDIHDFLSVHAPECMPIQSNKNDASNHSNQANLTTSLLHHLPDNTDQYSGVSKEFIPSCLQIDETLLNNKYVLKDLETLIGNIEQQQQQHQQKQQQQQQQLKPSKEVPMKIDNEYDPEVLRILTKSPIVMVKNRATPSKVTNNNSNNPTIQIDDVKNFMWQHIQEIVPNLVGQVEKELLSESENITMKQSVPFPSEAISTSTSLNAEPPPPVDHDEFLMEELIKPNLKNATIKEELPPVYKYAAEIETFRIVFDKALAKDYEREYDFDSLYGAKTRIFHLYEGHLKENTEQPSLHTKTLKNIPKEERKMKQNPSEESLIFTIAEEESSSSLNSNKKTILNTISKAKSHSSIPINNTGHKTLLFKRSSQSLTPEPLKFNKLEQNKMEHLTLNEAPNFDENIHNSDETTVEMEVQLSSVTCDSTNLNVRDKKFSKIPIRRTVKLNNSLNNFNDIQNVQASTTTTITQAKKVVNGPIKVPRKPETIATEDDTTETETIDTLNSNEMMLMIHHVPSSNSLDESSLLPATSTSTLHSLSSTSSDIKRISNETSSKQNLTDLVKDTQRIIQQMRDEINFNDIITSEESELYTDDYDTDEYEDDGDNDNDVGNEKDGNDNDDFEDEEQEDKEDWVVGMEYNDGSDNKKAITERINQNLIQQQELHTIGHLSANKNNQKNLSHFKSQELTENHENHNLEPHEASISLSNSRKLSSPSNDHIHIQSENEEKNPNQNSKKMLEDTSTLTLESSNPELVIKSIILTESVTHLSNALKPNSENEKAENNQVISPDASKMPNEMNTIENVSEKPENSIEQSSTNLHETGSESIAQLNNEIIANNNSMHNNGNFESEDNVPSTSKLAQANLTNLQIQNFSFIDQNSAESNVSNKDVTNKQQQEQSFKPLEPTKIVETNQNLKIAKTKSAQSSKIPKPKEMKIKDQKSASKKNINIRSKSFSVPPPTSIGINSVKTLRQELLKQTQKLNKSTTPSKQPPPPFVRKKSITDAITKLTKPNSSNLDEKTINSKLFLSKIRNHGKPRLPKKKYHETCFSDDDYESSTTSERECEHSELMEVTQRKLSVPVFRTYPNVQPEIDDIKTEDLIEKFLKEDMVASLAEAQIAVTLISMKFKQDVSIWAAKQCNDLDHAIALLQQECELCNGIYPLNEIVTMLKCTHKCCKDCAKKYFTVQITERSINDCNCPFCKLPELHQQNEYEDENLEYFSNLDIFLKNIINVEVHELFQLKLRDRTLLKDPNFKWCIQCSSGFFARPKQKRLICPDCGSVTCAQCRKTWQKQHENITCEQFTEWLQSNDPDAQHLGVQQHLEKNGIDCPKCKFRFSLSRGGCMHFTCTQCKYEFCYGCARPFMMGANCNISSYCAKLGLHAHHPRNCLFYLRDKLPIQLQILLRNNGVSYEEDNMDALGADITKSSNSNNSNRKISIRCPIPIQKETPSGLVDTICNNDVPDKHAGLCRNHYVEYLTSKVVKANIDPLPIFDLTDCVQELRRRGIALPERGPWDTDEIYKNMCAEVIKQNIPLDAV